MARPRVFLDVSIGAEPAGRLMIELFTDRTPKTCENFRVLCTSQDPKLSYALSPFHRIIDEFMIQGGDITKGDGTGGTSIYNHGGEFEDENLGWRDMDAAGLVCMANRGKHTNSSQFFITLEPCLHLNNKHTIFGRLVSGDDTLAKMSKVAVDDNDKPLEPVLIARCGELEKKGRPVAQPRPVSPDNVKNSTNRGRRRSSPSHAAQSRSRSRAARENQAQHEKRKRRMSDNVLDETLRGRPRARSKHDDAAVVDEEEIAEQAPTGSPGRKTKRSPSPSRAVDRAKDRRAMDDEVDSAESHNDPRASRNQYHGDAYARRRESARRDRNGEGRDADRNGYGTREEGRRRAGPRDWDAPREHDRRDNRRDDGRNDARNKRFGGKGGGYDRYRPAQSGRLGGGDEGRLGGGEGGDADTGAIIFKGRGSMKFREPDRRW